MHPAASTSAHGSSLKGASRTGFTLVELAMGVTVLALVLLSTITTMQRAFNQLDTARNLEAAGSILQCEMEKERLMSWDQLTDSSYQPSLDSQHAAIPQLAGRFSLNRSTSLVANHEDKLLQITLTVTWRSMDGRTLSRSYTTYYLKDGLHAYFYSQT